MDDEELTEQIKAQVDEWSSNSNECFHIQLLNNDGTTSSEKFQPEFTYPIFGDEEAIFGYQGLSINLTYAPHNLKPHLTIKYNKVFKALTENVKPTDIKEALKDFLPVEAFNGGSAKEALKDENAKDFVPPGNKVASYDRGQDGKFEVWCASLQDPRAKEILDRIGILVPMFIEGGTMLQLEQDWTTQRWKLFLLYNVSSPSASNDATFSPYSLAGYGTSYRIFTLPDSNNALATETDLTVYSQDPLESFVPPPEANGASKPIKELSTRSPLDLPSRERLSQFVILPPYQGHGHGQKLYNAMYLHLTAFPNVREFTVEDPNEAFDDLRDVCDLRYLRKKSPDFAGLRVNTDIPADQLSSNGVIPTDLIVPAETRRKVMQEFKINERQFDRLVEMHTLSFIPELHRSRSRTTRREKSSNINDRAFYFWRLYVKKRLYIFNRDQLAQLDREERVEKLEGAVDSVLEGYVGTLERVGAAEEEDAGEPSQLTKRKRKIIEEDEEDEDVEGDLDADMADEAEEVDDDGNVKANGRKKARTE